MPELVEALGLVALLAGTLQYAILIRHREEQRHALLWRAQVQESLVSSGQAETRPMRRWSADGTRFRADR
jgi:hypothetical protein